MFDGDTLAVYRLNWIISIFIIFGIVIAKYLMDVRSICIISSSFFTLSFV